jgi:hypothetical protein
MSSFDGGSMVSLYLVAMPKIIGIIKLISAGKSLMTLPAGLG